MPVEHSFSMVTNRNKLPFVLQRNTFRSARKRPAWIPKNKCISAPLPILFLTESLMFADFVTKPNFFVLMY